MDSVLRTDPFGGPLIFDHNTYNTASKCGRIIVGRWEKNLLRTLPRIRVSCRRRRQTKGENDHIWDEENINNG